MNLNTNYINGIKTNLANNYHNIDSSKVENKALRKATDDFEAFFMKQLLDISLKNTDIAGKSSGSDIIKSMYTQVLSEQSMGTMGISDMLYNFLSQKGNK